MKISLVSHSGIRLSHKIKIWHNQYKVSSSGSSGRVRGGPRNMKSMRPPSVAIFFMTYFHRAGGAMAPSAPPGSATGFVCNGILLIGLKFNCHSDEISLSVINYITLMTSPLSNPTPTPKSTNSIILVKLPESFP